MGRFLGDAKGAPVSKEGMTLIWSPESIHDLIALRAHIAEQDPAAAKRVALHILYCVEYLLSENPKLGAPGRVPGTRELVTKNALHRPLPRARHKNRDCSRLPRLTPLARPPVASRYGPRVAGQPIPICGSTKPRHTTKPSKIRDVKSNSAAPH
jgi:plasmid stabilization system protein ParE